MTSIQDISVVTSPPLAMHETAAKDPCVLGTWDLSYNLNGQWGLVNTPTRADAHRIAIEISKQYPFINGNALLSILNDSFDNVANYGRDGGYSTGTVTCRRDGDSLSVVITNPSSAVHLPEMLKGKTFTPRDGEFYVPREQRDPETGGGNGILLITRALPHIYWQLVQCSREPSISWSESPIDSANPERTQITFELRIPVPTVEEQRDLFAHRRTMRTLNLAEKSAQKIASQETDSTQSHARAIRLIAKGMQIFVERGEKDIASDNNHSFSPNDILLVSTFAEAIIKCNAVISDNLRQQLLQSLMSPAALLANGKRAAEAISAISRDKDSTRTDFLGAFTTLIANARYQDAAVNALATYAANAGDSEPAVINPLVNALVRGNGNAKLIIETLTTLERISDLEPALCAAIRRIARNKKEQSSFAAEAHFDALAALPEISLPTEQVLVRLLEKKGMEYCITKLLEDRTLRPSSIELAKSIFPRVAADTSESAPSMYDWEKLIKRTPSEFVSLFPTLRTMLTAEKQDHRYYATTILKALPLFPAQVDELIGDLKTAAASALPTGNNHLCSHLLEIIGQHSPSRLREVRPELIDMIIGNIEPYYATNALKTIGLSKADRARLRAAPPSASAKYYIEQALKIPIDKR